MTCMGIKGGKKLCGEVFLQGSKNAALPLIAASLLIRQPVVLENCPDITDVREMVLTLQELGAVCSFSGSRLVLDCSEVTPDGAGAEQASKTRGSVLFLGAMLGRFSKARLSYPGGCVIGKRPIDLHCEMLRTMGVVIEEREDALYAFGKPEGAGLSLAFPSVGATENVILAAVCAKGRTVLSGAATEPEVEELCEFLNQAGAKIEGIGSGQLTIDGVGELHEVCHRLRGDRIVAGTLLSAALITGGAVTLTGTKGVCLEGIERPLCRAGLFVKQEEDRIEAVSCGRIFPVPVLATAPFPGFPTDMQSVLMTVLALADGESRIYEALFESRFKIVPELKKMGADIAVDGRLATIRGAKVLFGTDVYAKELRGGAALLLAALAAEGETRVYGCENIERGYERIEEVLLGMGAEIFRWEES